MEREREDYAGEPIYGDVVGVCNSEEAVALTPARFRAATSDSLLDLLEDTRTMEIMLAMESIILPLPYVSICFAYGTMIASAVKMSSILYIA